MIVIQRAGGAALYLLPDGASYDLGDTLTLPDGTLVCDVNASTSEVETGVVAPDIFVGGAMRWADGAWTVTDQAAHDAALAAALVSAQTARVGQVWAAFQAMIAQGAPSGTERIQIDDGARANLTALGATALGVLSGALSWPDSYAKGWIAVSGARIPLATAQDGLQFSASIGAYYSELVQHGQDLQNAIKAAATLSAVAAVDVTQGWSG